MARRAMHWHLIAAGVTSAPVLAAFLVITPAAVAAQKAIRIGTSSTGSSFYAITVGMSEIIQKHAGLNVTVEPLGGSHANMFGLARGKVDFAVANSGATYDRYFGNKPFRKPFALRLVAQGQPSFRGLFIRKGSGIKTAKDVIGKIFLAKRKPLPELEKLAYAWLDVNKVPRSKVKIVSSRNLAEMNRVLRAGSVDIVAYPFGLRQPVATKLFYDNIMEPVIFSEKEYAEMKKRLPDMFFRYKVKANNFKNQPEPFLTFGLTTQLTTSDKMDEETAYKVAKAIFDNTKEFISYHKSARFWTAKHTAKDAKIPYHPGTIRYLKEAGLWTKEMAASQAKLLQRK